MIERRFLPSRISSNGENYHFFSYFRHNSVENKIHTRSSYLTLNSKLSEFEFYLNNIYFEGKYFIYLNEDKRI